MRLIAFLFILVFICLFLTSVDLSEMDAIKEQFRKIASSVRDTRAIMKLQHKKIIKKLKTLEFYMYAVRNQILADFKSYSIFLDSVLVENQVRNTGYLEPYPSWKRPGIPIEGSSLRYVRPKWMMPLLEGAKQFIQQEAELKVFTGSVDELKLIEIAKKEREIHLHNENLGFQCIASLGLGKNKNYRFSDMKGILKTEFIYNYIKYPSFKKFMEKIGQTQRTTTTNEYWSETFPEIPKRILNVNPLVEFSLNITSVFDDVSRLEYVDQFYPLLRQIQLQIELNEIELKKLAFLKNLPWQ